MTREPAAGAGVPWRCAGIGAKWQPLRNDTVSKKSERITPKENHSLRIDHIVLPSAGDQRLRDAVSSEISRPVKFVTVAF